MKDNDDDDGDEYNEQQSLKGKARMKVKLVRVSGAEISQYRARLWAASGSLVWWWATRASIPTRRRTGHCRDHASSQAAGQTRE